MKVKHNTIIKSLATLIVLSGVSVLSSSLVKSASAVSYQDNFDVEFTFNPTLNVTLDTNALTISDLAPGASAMSNALTVTVTTNNIAGYELSATVGNVSNASTDLRLSGTDSTNKFQMIASSGALSKGYWGYTLNNGTSFNALNVYTGDALTLNKTSDESGTASDSYAGGTTTSFKIGAYAADSQVAGDYTNVITFVAVTNVAGGGGGVTNYEMQNITKSELADLLPSVGDSMQMVDNRDGKKYWVTHEADGKYWMTQNLDLCIGCTGTVTLTSENTNLTTSGSGIYADSGYTSSGGVITWTPDATAVTSGRTISGTAVSGWTSDNNEPYSAEGGDTYYYTSGTTDNDTGTLATCLSANGNDEEYCKHWHVGNYYNWSAAIASNDSSSFYASTSDRYKNAENSICPAGWTLPYGRDSGNTATYREFGQLFLQAGITTSLTATSYNTNGVTNIRIAPLFFVRGGSIYSASPGNAASVGFYWSSSVHSVSSAYYMYFASFNLSSATNYPRDSGFSVRCLVR